MYRIHVYMIQVPGPHPPPLAMVMVEAHQPPLPPVEWVGSVGSGEGHPTSNQQQCNCQDKMK